MNAKTTSSAVTGVPSEYVRLGLSVKRALLPSGAVWSDRQVRTLLRTRSKRKSWPPAQDHRLVRGRGEWHGRVQTDDLIAQPEASRGNGRIRRRGGGGRRGWRTRRGRPAVAAGAAAGQRLRRLLAGVGLGAAARRVRSWPPVRRPAPRASRPRQVTRWLPAPSSARNCDAFDDGSSGEPPWSVDWAADELVVISRRSWTPSLPSELSICAAMASAAAPGRAPRERARSPGARPMTRAHRVARQHSVAPGRATAAD